MRLVTVVVFFLLVGAIYTLGGNTLDEQDVRDFYGSINKKVDELQDEELCQTLSDDFEMVAVTRVDFHEKRTESNKAEYCRDTARLMSQLRPIKEMLGRDYPFRYSQKIISIKIADDERSAVVQLRITMQLPGMRTTSVEHDTVVRERWRMLVKRSEATIWAGPAYK